MKKQPPKKAPIVPPGLLNEITACETMEDLLDTIDNLPNRQISIKVDEDEIKEDTWVDDASTWGFPPDGTAILVTYHHAGVLKAMASALITEQPSCCSTVFLHSIVVEGSSAHLHDIVLAILCQATKFAAEEAGYTFVKATHQTGNEFIQSAISQGFKKGLIYTNKRTETSLTDVCFEL